MYNTLSNLLFILNFNIDVLILVNIVIKRLYYNSSKKTFKIYYKLKKLKFRII